MENSQTKSCKLLELAETFRQNARTADMPDYARMMTKAARELEEAARDLRNSFDLGLSPTARKSDFS